MLIAEIHQGFTQAHFGTESFKTVRLQCESALQAGREHAAIYFFIAEYCRAHVNFYEDQEIAPEFAEAKHFELEAYLDILKTAMQHENPAQAYLALNRITLAYFHASGIV